MRKGEAIISEITQTAVHLRNKLRKQEKIWHEVNEQMNCFEQCWGSSLCTSRSSRAFLVEEAC